MITIPKLQELKDQIIADLENEFNISIPLFGKNFLRVLASVQAAKLKIIYLAIGVLQKNIFIDTADPESIGGTLERFGRIKLGRNPFAATAGEYLVDVTGTVSAVIDANTTFKSNDDSASPGKLFVLDADYTLLGVGDQITLRALEPGVESKLQVADQLTATSPIANVNQIVTVDSETTQPLAGETIEVYRTKGIDAYQLEAQGGAGTDYRLWSLDAQGVLRTFPYAKSGAANEINHYVEATIVDSSDGKGTPTAAILTAVEDVVEFDPDITRPLNERGRRPLAVFQVNFLAITPLDVDIEIDAYVGSTPAIETLIINGLTAFINKIRPFVSSSDVLANKNDILDINGIISEILEAQPGSSFGTVTLKVSSISVLTHTFENGDIPFVDTIIFT